MDWDIIVECAQNDKSKIDVSGFVFSLSDVIQLEERCQALKTRKRLVINGKDLIERWGYSAIEVEQILDSNPARAVDATGARLSDDIFEFLMLYQELNTIDMLYRLDDVELIEAEHPELKESHQKFLTSDEARLSDKKTEEESQVPTFCFYRNGERWRIGPLGKEIDFNHLEGFEFIRFLIRYADKTFGPLEVYYRGQIPDEFKKSEYQKSSSPETLNAVIAKKKDLEERLREEPNQEAAEELENEIEKFGKSLPSDRFVRPIN